MSFINRYAALPTAPSPNDDVPQIKGNLTLFHKQISANILAFYCSDKGFAHKEASNLKLVEVWVREVHVEDSEQTLPVIAQKDGTYKRHGGASIDTAVLEGRSICEIEVGPSKNPTLFDRLFAQILNVRLSRSYAQYIWRNVRRVYCPPSRYVRASPSHCVTGWLNANVSHRCTFSSLFTLACVTGVDTSGVSTAMNIIWHKPARL